MRKYSSDGGRAAKCSQGAIGEVLAGYNQQSVKAVESAASGLRVALEGW